MNSIGVRPLNLGLLPSASVAAWTLARTFSTWSVAGCPNTGSLANRMKGRRYGTSRRPRSDAFMVAPAVARVRFSCQSGRGYLEVATIFFGARKCCVQPTSPVRQRLNLAPEDNEAGKAMHASLKHQSAHFVSVEGAVVFFFLWLLR
jgi:hypothetical protein